MKNINKVKDKIQKEAVKSIVKVGGRSLITIATGGGKSRIPLLYLKEKDYQRIALIVPTEKLRDSNWYNEYQDWDMLEYWYNSNHCINLPSSIQNPFPNREFLPAEDYGYIYFSSTFKEFLNQEYQLLLKQYFQI